MLKKYGDILDKALSAKLESLTAWYMFYHVKENPFSSQIPLEEIDYFVNRTELIDSIVYDVGVSSRGIPLTVLLVGPLGSGKTSVLRYVYNVLGKLKQENPDKFFFKGDITSSNALFDKQETAQENSIDDDAVQCWTKMSKVARDYLFVDDAKASHVETILHEFTATTLEVFSLSPLDYEEVYRKFPVAPKTYFLNPLKFEDATLMLRKRIERVMTEKDNHTSLFDLFEEDALKTVFTYGMGNPGLILRCAAQSLNLLLDLNSHERSASPKTEEKITEDIALRACKVVSCYSALTKFNGLSQTKIEVLEKILDYGKSPTELSSILRKDRTTMSRHLNDLKEEGVVEFVGRGRESVYKATDSVRIMIETQNMPRGR